MNKFSVVIKEKESMEKIQLLDGEKRDRRNNRTPTCMKKEFRLCQKLAWDPGQITSSCYASVSPSLKEELVLDRESWLLTSLIYYYHLGSSRKVENSCEQPHYKGSGLRCRRQRCREPHQQGLPVLRGHFQMVSLWFQVSPWFCALFVAFLCHFNTFCS